MFDWLPGKRRPVSPPPSPPRSTPADRPPPGDAQAPLPGPFAESTARFLELLSRGHYDFVDLGTCNGGGFQIAARQGGRRGLGFDLEPVFVRNSRAKGLDVTLYDVCDLRTDEPVVDFAVCSHILEHLPSPSHIERVLKALSSMCRDYILIFGPCFEEEDYLLGLDLKLLHSLQLDHTCKITVGEIMGMLHRLGLRDYVVALTERIHDSDNHWIHNARQVVPSGGLWTYDAEKHLAKPKTSFDREIHRDFVCVVALRSGLEVDDILSKFFWGYERVVNRSCWRFPSRNGERA